MRLGAIGFNDVWLRVSGVCVIGVTGLPAGRRRWGSTLVRPRAPFATRAA